MVISNLKYKGNVCGIGFIHFSKFKSITTKIDLQENDNGIKIEPKSQDLLLYIMCKSLLK